MDFIWLTHNSMNTNTLKKMMESFLFSFFLDPLGPKGARGPPGEVLGDVSGTYHILSGCISVVLV